MQKPSEWRGFALAGLQQGVCKTVASRRCLRKPLCHIVNMGEMAPGLHPPGSPCSGAPASPARYACTAGCSWERIFLASTSPHRRTTADFVVCHAEAWQKWRLPSAANGLLLATEAAVCFSDPFRSPQLMRQCDGREKSKLNSWSASAGDAGTLSTPQGTDHGR